MSTKVSLQLFGAFRDVEPSARIDVDVAGERVADLRAAVVAYSTAQWPGALAALVARSAFASESSILRDADAIPADGAMALLPPVSGG